MDHEIKPVCINDSSRLYYTNNYMNALPDAMIIINGSSDALGRTADEEFEMTRRNEAATREGRDLQKTWRSASDGMCLGLFEGTRQEMGRSEKIIQEVFKGWVRYWSWHRGHKQAFELKYAVVKHGVDLDAPPRFLV